MHRVIDLLKNRNLLSNVTHTKTAISTNKNVAVYCGFDPTADALHVGNLVQTMALKMFQNNGIKPIILVSDSIVWVFFKVCGRLEERRLKLEIRVENLWNVLCCRMVKFRRM